MLYVAIISKVLIYLVNDDFIHLKDGLSNSLETKESFSKYRDNI
jgi:hypothetical protein